MSSQTVFVPFRYCPLCRLNHKKGKKHVFSQKHTEIVANILAKFLKKITEAKEFLKKPSVKDITWDQAGNKFWCYFCQEDVDKHRLSVLMLGQCVVEYGGLLEHITRTDHTQNTAKFLKENKLDMKRTSEYIINEKVYLKYLEDVESAASQFFMLKSQVLTQISSQIRAQSVIRHEVVASSLREQTLQQHCMQQQQQQPHILAAGTRGPKPVKGPVSSEEKGKKTVQAFGEGLTAIERIDEDDSAGNIYTNAVPPWMQPDQVTTPSTCVVGPTMDDLEKHRKLERKRLLPACRVGAKFDHKSSETGMWLPDFGGVWNHGRRTKSGHQFIKRQKRGVSSHSSSSSPPLLGGSNQQPVSLPQTTYSFPEMPRRTATVTSNSDSLTNTNHLQSVDKINCMVTDSGSVFPFGAACVTQNADFCYHQGSVKSTPASASSAGARSLTGNPVHQVSDLVSVDSSVTVKPYVRKHRSASYTTSEQNQPVLPVYLPQVPVYCPPQFDHLNTRNSTSEAHTHNSAFYPKIPCESQLFSGHGEHWQNNVTTHQVMKQGSQSSICDGRQNLETGSFRLLATPVLSQQKSSPPSKTLFGAGRSGK
ncbi:hypothetical protein BsWGS_17689 [Bradybaena similaris]